MNSQDVIPHLHTAQHGMSMPVSLPKSVLLFQLRNNAITQRLKLHTATFSWQSAVTNLSYTSMSKVGTNKNDLSKGTAPGGGTVQNPLPSMPGSVSLLHSSLSQPISELCSTLSNLLASHPTLCVGEQYIPGVWFNLFYQPEQFVSCGNKAMRHI